MSISDGLCPSNTCQETQQTGATWEEIWGNLFNYLSRHFHFDIFNSEINFSPNCTSIWRVHNYVSCPRKGVNIKNGRTVRQNSNTNCTDNEYLVFLSFYVPIVSSLPKDTKSWFSVEWCSRNFHKAQRTTSDGGIIFAELKKNISLRCQRKKEKRRTLQLSAEFSLSKSRIMGALSKLDRFLLNPHARVHIGSIPQNSRQSNK